MPWITTDANGNVTSRGTTSPPNGAREISDDHAQILRDNPNDVVFPASSGWPLVKPVPPRPEPVPRVPAWQVKYYLAKQPSPVPGSTATSFLEEMERAVALMPRAARVVWDSGAPFDRDSALLKALQVRFAISDTARDAILIAAAKIALSAAS